MLNYWLCIVLFWLTDSLYHDCYWLRTCVAYWIVWSYVGQLLILVTYQWELFFFFTLGRSVFYVLYIADQKWSYQLLVFSFHMRTGSGYTICCICIPCSGVLRCTLVFWSTSSVQFGILRVAPSLWVIHLRDLSSPRPHCFLKKIPQMNRGCLALGKHVKYFWRSIGDDSSPAI